MSATARPFRLVTPAACSALMSGASFAALSSASAWRASRAAWRAVGGKLLGLAISLTAARRLIGDEAAALPGRRGAYPGQGRAPSPGRFSHGGARRTVCQSLQEVSVCAGAVPLIISTNSPLVTKRLGAGFTNRAGHARSIRILTQFDRMRLDRRSGLVATYRRPCVEKALPEYFLRHHRAP